MSEQKFFDFPSFETKTPDKITEDGKKLYRFRNLVPRVSNREGKKRGPRIPVGRMGGYVEHPELLDPTMDIYIGVGGYLYGYTTFDVENVEVYNATIIDSTIKGKHIQVGHFTSNSYADEGYIKRTARKPAVLIKNCQIDAENAVFDFEPKIYNSAFTGKDICVEDAALISNSECHGEVYVGGDVKIIQCKVTDAQIAGTAFVYESEIQESSIFSNLSYKTRKIRGANVRIYDDEQEETQ